MKTFVKTYSHRLPQGFRVQGLRQRRQLRKLLAYNDHTLADMGHSRSEILRTLKRTSQAPYHGVSNIHLQNMHPEHMRLPQ